MSIKIEKTENNNELKLEFVVEAAKFDEGMKKVYAKSAKYFNIPGFRKGKAPMAIVEKMYGSEIFYEDTFNEIVPEIMAEECEKNNIEVIAQPKIDIKEIGKGKDLVFTAVVKTKPEAKLGKYKGITIEKVEYPVTDEDIEEALKAKANQNARLISVEDRAVENGDIAVINYEGFVGDKAFEGGKAENYELEIGSNTFIPGFEEQIIGMKIDEKKDIMVKFPDEYHAEDLKGKDAMFKIELLGIKKKELPEINDEFAKDISEFDTLDELKASIRETKITQNEARAKNELENKAIEKVCEKAEVEVPNEMVETELDNTVKMMNQQLQYQGMNLDTYAKLTGTTVEEIRNNYRESAEKKVKTSLVLEAIVKAENIEVTDEELTAKLEELAAMYGTKADELRKNEMLVKEVTKSLKNEKAIKVVVDNVKIK